jgi:hypothetical protein
MGEVRVELKIEVRRDSNFAASLNSMYIFYFWGGDVVGSENLSSKINVESS